MPRNIATSSRESNLDLGVLQFASRVLESIQNELKDRRGQGAKYMVVCMVLAQVEEAISHTLAH